jgi:hypothetical protein
MKLFAHPAAVYAIARLVSLPPLETQTVVMLASLPIGANVYLMSREFRTLEAAIATSLVLSTALAAVTTPFALALLGAARRASVRVVRARVERRVGSRIIAALPSIARCRRPAARVLTPCAARRSMAAVSSPRARSARAAR